MTQTAPNIATHPTAAVEGLPDMLLKAYDEICVVLRRLRESRDQLQQSTVGKLQHTSAKLNEVSSATEVAANGILDGLDRAAALVDELDGLDKTGDEKATSVRGQLRDELFAAIGFLQFQDITSQQLSYASSLLHDMEDRLGDLAKVLDPSVSAPSLDARPALKAFDPQASTQNAEGRQALADSIFTHPD